MTFETSSFILASLLFFNYTESMHNDRKTSFFNSVTFLASIFILISGPLLAQTLIHILLQIFGLLIILWSFLATRANKTKKIHTLPPGYFYTTHGPYEIVRHPIYLGYVLFMFGGVVDTFTFLRLLAFLLLLFMIILKIIREEHIMSKSVREYQEYKAKSKAIIPFLL